MSGINAFEDLRTFEGFPPTRPSAARLEFLVRAEQGRRTADAPIGALRFVIPVLAGESRFGRTSTRHRVLSGRQSTSPVTVGVFGFGGAIHTVSGLTVAMIPTAGPDRAGRQTDLS